MLCRKGASRCPSKNPQGLLCGHSGINRHGKGLEILRARRAEKRQERKRQGRNVLSSLLEKHEADVLIWSPTCHLCGCHHVPQFSGSGRSVLSGVHGGGRPSWSSCSRETVSFPRLSGGSLCKRRSKAAPRVAGALLVCGRTQAAVHAQIRRGLGQNVLGSVCVCERQRETGTEGPRPAPGALAAAASPGPWHRGHSS